METPRPATSGMWKLVVATWLKAKLDVASAEWAETFEKMRHRYLHHIDEEEEDMFPEASEKLSGETEERLARIFEDRKPKELAIAEEEKPGDERE